MQGLSEVSTGSGKTRMGVMADVAKSPKFRIGLQLRQDPQPMSFGIMVLKTSIEWDLKAW